jgi:hypothetical protein
MTRRAAIVLVVGLVALPLLGVLGGCGDTDEQRELRAYSDWIDGVDKRHQSVLEPIQAELGSIDAFVADLPQRLGNGDLLQIIQGSRSIRPALAGIRDDVVPAFAKLRAEVEGREIESARIRDVHERLIGSLRLYGQFVDGLGEIADQVDRMDEIGKSLESSDRRAQEEKVNREAGAILNGCIEVYQKTGDPILVESRKADAALEAAGEASAESREKAKLVIAKQDELFRGFLAAIQRARSAEELMQILALAETRLIPDVERVVEIARTLETPEGDAAVAWKKVVENLEKRLASLKTLPEIVEKVTTFDQEPRQIQMLAESFLHRYDSLVADLQQAKLDHERFKEKVRRLRAEIL